MSSARADRREKRYLGAPTFTQVEERESATLRLSDELHPAVKQAQWLAQRVMWLVMAMFLVAALIGFLGTGLFSGDTVASSSRGGRIEVDYERWTRATRLQSMRITLQPSAPGDVQLLLADAFARRISIENVSPPPDTTALTAIGPAYGWRAEDANDLAIEIEFRALNWGRLAGDVMARLNGEEQRLRFTQFVAP